MTGTSAPAAPPTPSTAPQPLALVAQLARGLEQAGIEYCHWKSNEAIDRSMSGDNDLDLLVSRRHVQAFVELLSASGFVRSAKRTRRVPGIESFYGLDEASGRLVHVHAHYALVLGDDRTKNHRLPIEDAYIRSSKPAAGVDLRIPAAEFELAVLVIRLVLKYCTWDEMVWNRARGRRAGPSHSERREFAYLLERAGPAEADSVLLAHAPYCTEELFAECLHAVAPGAPLGTRLRAGRRLERCLQANARRSRRADRTLRVVRRFTEAARRRLRRRDRNRPAAGGALIAIIGGDGAGKSTALATLEGWLGASFDVRVVHLGKPSWSRTTYCLRAILKVVHRASRVLPRPISDRVTEFRSVTWLLCTGRDRQLAYRRARRFTSQGGIVLCDRYPHPRVMSMEGPLIRRTVGDDRMSAVVRAMCRREECYHRSIAPPDLLAVLRLDPEIAVERKWDENPDSVRRRSTEIWQADWRGSGAHVVDASRPKEAVAGELKALVWSTLG